MKKELLVVIAIVSTNVMTVGTRFKAVFTHDSVILSNILITVKIARRNFCGKPLLRVISTPTGKELLKPFKKIFLQTLQSSLKNYFLKKTLKKNTSCGEHVTNYQVS